VRVDVRVAPEVAGVLVARVEQVTLLVVEEPQPRADAAAEDRAILQVGAISRRGAEELDLRRDRAQELQQGGVDLEPCFDLSRPVPTMGSRWKLTAAFSANEVFATRAAERSKRRRRMR
jgi:hypothetical protein